jgi:Mn2+/Fe2+ NRAMP family transporter
MNKKQLIAASGLVAYIVGGLIVVIFNLETFIGIIRFQPHLLTPILKTFAFISIVDILIIYFLRDKNK